MYKQKIQCLIDKVDYWDFDTWYQLQLLGHNGKGRMTFLREILNKNEDISGIYIFRIINKKNSKKLQK